MAINSLTVPVQNVQIMSIGVTKLGPVPVYSNGQRIEGEYQQVDGKPIRRAREVVVVVNGETLSGVTLDTLTETDNLPAMTAWTAATAQLRISGQSDVGSSFASLRVTVYAPQIKAAGNVQIGG